MPSWADLDKLATTKPRPDGTVSLVALDDRSRADIEATRPLSILVAISRVVRGKLALERGYGGRGSVIYACRSAPAFLVDAVTAAGGRVLDGQTERVATAPLPATVQLDAASCDLATAVRRRLGAKTFAAALELREAELRRRPADRDAPAELWPAVLELAALAGELVRADRAARWVARPDARPPLALDLGGGRELHPGKLALAIAQGGGGSLRQLVALEDKLAQTTPLGRPMPLLVPRTAVPLARLTWEPLLAAEVDHPDVPVIAYVEDVGEGISFPTDKGPPDAALRTRALDNVTRIAASIEELPLPFGRVALVTGDYFAAEKLLDPAFMRRVASQIGAGDVLLVGTPVRGELLAIDAAAAMLDDDFHRAFAGAIASAFEGAPERDRISQQVLIYQGKPLGRLAPTAASSSTSRA